MNYMQILHLFAPLIGIAACLIGCLAIATPKAMSKGFGVAIDGPALSYVIGIGVRDIFIGGTILMAYINKLWLFTAQISLLIAVVAIVDFWVVFSNGDRKTSFVHLSGAIVATAYGMALYLII